jgi:hypothetical protein
MEAVYRGRAERAASSDALLRDDASVLTDRRSGKLSLDEVERIPIQLRSGTIEFGQA